MMVQTEIGLLPEDWEVVQISEVGSNYSYGVGAEAVMYDGKNKYLRITDIDDNSHRYSPAPIVSPSFFAENHILRENEIVVARTGASVGKSYIYDPQDGKLIYAGFLMKFKVSDENSKYVFYHLTTKRYNTWVTMNSVRSGQPGLNLVQLKEFQFPLPKDKSEQQNIASALSSIDKLIDDLRRTIQKKQRIREGAMEELLSGKKRLPGFTEDWVENTFDELFKPYSTASYSREEMIEGNVLCIHYGDIHTKYGSVVYLDSDEIQTITKEQAGRYTRLKDGDIIMADASEDYEGIGKCIAVITCGKEAIAGLHTILLRPKANDLFDHRFTSYILSHRSTKKQIEYLSEGTKVNSISFNKIKAVTVTYPSSLKEQRTIADILTSMDDEISVLQIEKAKYEQIRSGMMEELLTGKKRLK
ncbi:MAG: restriction endonuclease subunit S [Paludibacteraceae bacterium]|nr:restriction endonuclease subunit S [Paludibacteraceae bacterium]